MPNITLPNNWTPRKYQLPVLKYFDGGGKRAVTVWARRHGKDSTAINYTAKASFERVGLYWHILPTLRQARKAVWNAIDKQGRRVINQAFPPEIQKRQRDDEMLIELKNGSMYQAVGADNHDALVGSNPVGVIFSEWSLMDPKTWDFIRPILMENGGWAWFIYTPRGRNHGHALLESARKTPGWFHEVVDIRQAGVLDVEAVLAEERMSGMPEELIQQEYFCSFDIGNVGTIFAREMDRAGEQGRIGQVPYDPNFPVETAWDLGMRDSTAIWFFQRVGLQVRAIDYYENTGQGLEHYFGVLRSKPYAYSRHVAPHDIEVRELGTGKSRKEVAESFGILFDRAPKLTISDGINAARALVHKTWFDETKCEPGIKALKNYRREYDEDNRVFKQDPVHDWASHGASAYRYYAVMPELEYILPQWLKELGPTHNRFGPTSAAHGIPNTISPGGIISPTPEWYTGPIWDPLSEFRG